jgi:uncharacterized membrane protein YvbJ
MKICLWCGKEIDKHKDSICEECGEKVLNGEYVYSFISENINEESMQYGKRTNS